MDVRDFGEALIKTGDLDPVYIAIEGAGLPEPQLCRLLVAYWCFYHLGAAAWLSEHEGRDYWDWMGRAAENRLGPPGRVEVQFPWPRSSERRHFRGEKCVTAVHYLSGWGAEDRVRALADRGTERRIMDTVKEWPLFGPWIAFKVADMMERCYHAPVEFSADTILMYEEPSRALDMLAGSDGNRQAIYQRLIGHFHRYPAPPDERRRCGPQEVETVLCKWKSMMGGHYWVGKDIHEVGAGLEGWGTTASKLSASVPPMVVNGSHP